MSIESDLTPENVKSPQRRTMMKAAAWAAPVVAIAATAPMAAASLNSNKVTGSQIGTGSGQSTTSVNMNGVDVDIYPNVWSSQGSIGVQGGEAGDATGVIIVTVIVPQDRNAGAAYPLFVSNGNPTSPSTVGDALGASGTVVSATGEVWTYVRSRSTYTFRNPGITLGAGETAGVVTFSPLLATGYGAYNTDWPGAQGGPGVNTFSIGVTMLRNSFTNATSPGVQIIPE